MLILLISLELQFISDCLNGHFCEASCVSQPRGGEGASAIGLCSKSKIPVGES
jgi:hypothetical protein